MPVVDLSALPALLGRDARLMGLDLGSKTVGVALSDVGRAIATPLETIAHKKFTPTAQRILDLADKNGVGAMIVGLPLQMDGAEGPRCQSVRDFVAELLKRRDLPVAFQDERLSTVAVERVLIDDADLSRQRRAQVVDRAAAAYILQGALDRLNRL